MNHQEFFNEKIKKIFSESKTVIDIGGGLRVDSKRGNRFDKENSWLLPYISRVDYKVLDKVADYHPDIVGDIHNLPLGDNSVDAVICIAVLEHVENPQLAVKEIYRVLKPGGFCFIFAPFLYYYHPCPGYYGDYFRFTKDGLGFLFKDFSSIECCNTRGALETVTHLLPYALGNILKYPARFLDKVFKKDTTNQTSGYNLFAIK